MELRRCCEFCEYYEVDYEVKCITCRLGEGESNHSNFEISKELIAWKENNGN
jgi:hypothetical protein